MFLRLTPGFLELSDLPERSPSELLEKRMVHLTLTMLSNSGVSLSGTGAVLMESVLISLLQKMYTGLNWERNQV